MEERDIKSCSDILDISNKLLLTKELFTSMYPDMINLDIKNSGIHWLIAYDLRKQNSKIDCTSCKEERNIMVNQNFKYYLNKEYDLLYSLKLVNIVDKETIKDYTLYHHIINKKNINRINNLDKQCNFKELSTFIGNYSFNVHKRSCIDIIQKRVDYLDSNCYNINKGLVSTISRYLYSIDELNVISSLSITYLSRYLDQNAKIRIVGDINGYNILLDNLCYPDFLPLIALQYSTINIYLCYELNEQLYHLPKVFFNYILNIDQGNCINRNRLECILRLPLNIPSINSISGNGICYNKNYHTEVGNFDLKINDSNIKLEPEICKICLENTVSCHSCKIADILYCYKHSIFIDKYIYKDLSIFLCTKCKDRYCSMCYISVIGKCKKCNGDVSDKKCYSHTKCKTIIKNKEIMLVCNTCAAMKTCYQCRKYDSSSNICNDCSKPFCNDCNKVYVIDTSPNILFPDRIVRMIGRNRSICTKCMNGRTIDNILNEERIKYDNNL